MHNAISGGKRREGGEVKQGEQGSKKGGNPVGRQIFDVCLFIFTKRNEWEKVDIGRELTQRERGREGGGESQRSEEDQISDFFFFGGGQSKCIMLPYNINCKSQHATPLAFNSLCFLNYLPPLPPPSFLLSSLLLF